MAKRKVEVGDEVLSPGAVTTARASSALSLGGIASPTKAAKLGRNGESPGARQGFLHEKVANCGWSGVLIRKDCRQQLT